jgi:hypothetical protein
MCAYSVPEYWEVVHIEVTALDHLIDHSGGLLRAIRIQFDPVPARTCIARDLKECGSIADTWVYH